MLLPTPFAKGTEVSDLINSITGIRGKIDCYLEIGVEYAKTLEAVRARKKIGVDPNFRFHRGFQAFNLCLYQMTSKQYFELGNTELIDIVFLDGLHSAKQTYSDFINSLSRVNRKSMIIIDDTVPSDIHSTLKTPEATYISRNKAGLQNNFKWHGDVYRCIYFIIENFPKLKYATISDIDNPVTVFYGFSEANKYLNYQQLKIKKSYDIFLNNNKIMIPKEFNPITKKDFYHELGNFYENV